MKSLRHAAFLIFGFTGSLFANGGGYSSGVKSMGAFQPIGVDQVQMVSEDLEIDLHIEYAIVRIEYVLHNPGKKVKVTAGFPSAVYEFAWGVPRAPAPLKVLNERLRDFAISSDNQKLGFEVKTDAMELNPTSMGRTNVNAWHVVEMKFDAGQTQRIKVSYRQDYHHSVSSVSDDLSASAPVLTYLFSAAGLWEGPIERGTIRVRAVSVDPADVSFSHPKRFQPDPEGWTWNFRDLEPTLEDDLMITAGPSIQSYPQESGPAYAAYGSKGKPRRWEMLFPPDSAEASSFLTEPDGVKHEAKNALDVSHSTAWVEGAEGDGIGESITLKLKRPAKIGRIGVINGYAESEDLYLANNRVAELAVSLDGGKPFTVTLPDERLRSYFFFNVPGARTASSIRLAIQKVYKGTTFQDTALTGVMLAIPLAKEPKITPIR